MNEVSKEVWAGLDVSKDYFDASRVTAQTDLKDFTSIPHFRFSRNPAGVRDFLAWLDQFGEQPVRVIMEVTGRYSLELMNWLVQERPQLQPAIVNPRHARHFHKSLGLRNKTDKVDCRSLGLMGRERRPSPYEGLPQQFRHIRDLMRQRRHLVNLRTAETFRLKEAKDGPDSLREVLQSHLLHIEESLKTIDKAIDKIVACCSHLENDLELMQTIPGVGRITALTVVAELGDLRRFNRSRQVSALSGLSPANHQSGSSTHFSHIDRAGHADLRCNLYLAARSASTVNKDNHLARTYQRLLHRGKQKKQALTAIARKIPVIMRALLIHEQPYIDDFQNV